MTHLRVYTAEPEQQKAFGVVNPEVITLWLKEK